MLDAVIIVVFATVAIVVNNTGNSGEPSKATTVVLHYRVLVSFKLKLGVSIVDCLLPGRGWAHKSATDNQPHVRRLGCPRHPFIHVLQYGFLLLTVVHTISACEYYSGGTVYAAKVLKLTEAVSVVRAWQSVTNTGDIHLDNPWKTHPRPPPTRLS